MGKKENKQENKLKEYKFESLTEKDFNFIMAAKKALEDENDALIKELKETMDTKEKLTKDNDINSQKAKKAEEYLQLLKNLQTDFDSFKNRNKDLEINAKENGIVELAREILPVLDNFERALNAFDNEGINLIYRQLKDALKKEGIEEIVCLNEDFDPNLHEAMMQVPAESKEQEGKITTVLMTGYKLNDKVIRHAKVAVAK